MMIFVVESALYIAAKFDESGLTATFTDFHEAVLDLQSFQELLHTAEVPSEAFFWEPGMYKVLEQSLVETLRWQINQVTSADVLVNLVALRAKTCFEAYSIK
jgi:menaquinone-dependent protoporphyrinogen IX oxidase